MLVAVLRRGSRATTARECAHLTGSWSKDVHINPSSTFAERTLSGVDTSCSPLPPTRRCRSSSSSAGDKWSGAHERSWAASSIGGSHGASPDPRQITAQLKHAQGARAILANVGNHLEKLNPIHASFALNLLGKDASRNRKGQLRDLLRDDGAFAGLLQLTKQFATEFPARELSNALHGIAKLCQYKALAARGATTVEVIDALDAGLVKCAGDLEPQGVSNVWWA